MSSFPSFQQEASAMIDWTQLPSDLLELILSNLPGKDQRALNLVCRSWHETVKALGKPYSPFLMRYHPRTLTWKFHNSITRSHSTFNDSIPELNGAEIRCFRHGWLLIFQPKDKTLSFLAPSSRRMIHLPDTPKVGYTNLSFFGPPDSQGFTVVGIRTPSWKQVANVCVLRHPYSKWETSSHYTGGKFLVSLAAPVMHRGLAHFVDVRGNVARLNVAFPTGRLMVPKSCLRQRIRSRMKEAQYLLEMDEDLLGVFVLDDQRRVRVYKLSKEDGRWDPVVSDRVESRVLYLSQRSSFGVKTKEGKKGNMACFTKFYGESPVAYSLEDHKYRSLDGKYTAQDAIGLQRFDSAIWFMSNGLLST